MAYQKAIVVYKDGVEIAKHLTQKSAYKSVGVSKDTISRILCGSIESFRGYTFKYYDGIVDHPHKCGVCKKTFNCKNPNVQCMHEIKGLCDKCYEKICAEPPPPENGPRKEHKMRKESGLLQGRYRL